MTATEVFELSTHGGATDFARLNAACETQGPYCLIGDMAVNCYVEPIFTLDIEIVTAHPPPFTPESNLRVRFVVEESYQSFLNRTIEAEVLGVRVRIACLEDVTQGKLWAYAVPARRLSKRKKDELDLIRLAEAYPELKFSYPADLRAQIDRG